MTIKRDDELSAEPVESEEKRSTPPVATRVGRNTVDIDVPALRHLVDTVKDKLKP